MGSRNIVNIFDTTLRDGEQSPGASMNIEEKVLIARQLDKLGVDVIEAGFAASSPGDFESVVQVCKAVKRSHRPESGQGAARRHPQGRQGGGRERASPGSIPSSPPPTST